MAHGMLSDLPGETVNVWTVIVTAAALRKYTEQTVALFFLYINCVFIGCCRYSIPHLFPDDCVSVFDNVTCEYIVHKKDNQSMLCPIYAAVGK